MLSSPPRSLARSMRRLQASRMSSALAVHDLQDLVVAHHAREAVGAEDVDVARLRVVVLEVDDDLVLHAERARDDVLRQLALLLVGQVGHREQVVVDERVVARQLLDLRRSRTR